MIRKQVVLLLLPSLEITNCDPGSPQNQNDTKSRKLTHLLHPQGKYNIFLTAMNVNRNFSGFEVFRGGGGGRREGG